MRRQSGPETRVATLDWDEPIAVDEDVTARVVASVLARYAVGAVLVRSRRTDARTVSERDIVAAVARGLDLERTLAGDIAGPGLVTADPQEHLVDVARRMVDQHVRHVGIVVRDEVVGMLSMRDLVAALIDS